MARDSGAVVLLDDCVVPQHDASVSTVDGTPPAEPLAGSDAANAGRRRGIRFFAKVLVANVLVLTVAFLLGELVVRVWREGGVIAGVRSFATDRPMPRGLGTGDWLVSDEQRGYVLRAGVNGTNELHMRHGSVATEKPVDAFRLLVLGDSVAFPDTGFVAMVRRDCAAAGQSRVDVLNAAVPGYTTWQEARHLDALVEPVAPDAVLLQYCCNDNHRFLHQLTGEGGWLITEEARRALLPEGGGLLTSFARWSYLALEVRRLLLANRSVESVFPWDEDAAFAAAWRDDSWILVEEQIVQMRAQVLARPAKFAVVAVPYEPQLEGEALARDEEYTRKPQRRLAEMCARLDIPFLDLHAAFRQHRDEGLYTDGIHLTPAGHELAAAELLPFLRRHELLPPR